MTATVAVAPIPLKNEKHGFTVGAGEIHYFVFLVQQMHMRQWNGVAEGGNRERV